MDTRLADFIVGTSAGKEAEAILRKCVHCGFCTATCPTYQLLGDELDGPRGRIYLIKQLLEGQPATEKTRLHLDRCLTCRSCETTCPSGVQYSNLLDIGRQVLTDRLPRMARERLLRHTLREGMTRPWLFGPAVKLGQWLRPLLPSAVADKLPLEGAGGSRARPDRNVHSRRMVLLAGCVQPSLAPEINAATMRVFDALEISLVEAAGAGCCGALRFHLDDQETARQDMRRNIDAWWPLVETGIEAIVVTASACGVQVRDYGHALSEDPDYAAKATRISELCRDPGEILLAEHRRLAALLIKRKANRGKLAFHSPCTLQHGLKIRGVIEGLLTESGYELVPVAEAHLCCGSAGTYSVLQAEISRRLRDRKLEALTGGLPTVIATANVGCLVHLQAGSALPVRHWIELIDELL